MSTEARIQFAKLKGFPAGDHDKIETEEFLAASNEIVDVIREYFLFFRNCVVFIYNILLLLSFFFVLFY